MDNGTERAGKFCRDCKHYQFWGMTPNPHSCNAIRHVVHGGPTDAAFNRMVGDCKNGELWEAAPITPKEKVRGWRPFSWGKP